MSGRAGAILFAAALSSAFAGCASPEESTRESRETAASWCATVRETAAALSVHRVPAAYAKNTFRSASDALGREGERLTRLAVRSRAAADAVEPVAEAAGAARSLSAGGGDLSAAARRFDALATRLRARATP